MRRLRWCTPRLTLGIDSYGDDEEILPVGNQSLDVSDVHFWHGDVSAFVAGDFSALTTVEVILPAFAHEELTSFGDRNALGNGFVCFEFHTRESEVHDHVRATGPGPFDRAWVHVRWLGFSSDDRGDIAASAGRSLFDHERILFFNSFAKFLNALVCQIAMFLFAATKHDFDFELIAVCEKALGLLPSNINVMLAHFDRKTNAFDIHFLCASLLNAHLFLLLVFELAKVQKFAHGRHSFGRDLNEVIPAFLCHADGFACGNDPNRLAFLINHANVRGNDLFVDAIDR